jgi:16S rRNA (guanine527-N7)-methyltransferase
LSADISDNSRPLLDAGLERLGFSVRAERERAAALFETYLDEWALFNPSLSLTGESERAQIITRHIFDSAAAFFIIEKLARASGDDPPNSAVVADVGSGGGFPGIPLAVCASAVRSQTRFVLIERSQKKCAFLENCAALMKLDNVSVENADMNGAGRNRFAVCAFRSFHPLDKKLLARLFSLTADGGFLAAYKARIETIEREMDAAGAVSWKAEKLVVPFLEDRERHLVCIKK